MRKNLKSWNYTSKKSTYVTLDENVRNYFYYKSRREKIKFNIYINDLLKHIAEVQALNNQEDYQAYLELRAKLEETKNENFKYRRKTK